MSLGVIALIVATVAAVRSHRGSQQLDQAGEACRLRVHQLPELPHPVTALCREAQLGPTRHDQTPLKSEVPPIPDMVDDPPFTCHRASSPWLSPRHQHPRGRSPNVSNGRAGRSGSAGEAPRGARTHVEHGTGDERGTVALSATSPGRLGARAGPLVDEAAGMKNRRAIGSFQPPRSAFTGFRFPPEVFLIAVRWYLRDGLSYRDLEELLAERGIEVDHVTLSRSVQRFTPLLVDAARPCRHSVGGHWFVDETDVKVSGSWRYAYRAVDQHGQVIDVLLSKKRDLKAATRFFAAMINSNGEPAEVTTDRAQNLVRIIADLLPAALHDTTQYANNRVEADHGRLKARLRPMRGLKRDRTASVVIRGHNAA